MYQFYSTRSFLFVFICLFIFQAQAICQTIQITGNQSNSPNMVIGTFNYHVSESIYTEAEIGSSNFITAGTAINHIDFNVFAVGAPDTIKNFRLYLKEVPLATTSFTAGIYSTSGYTLVFDGTYVAPATGWVGVDLTTTFTRTSGSNLQLLIERLDNVNHFDSVNNRSYSFYAARGNSTNLNTTSNRRYNNNTLPASGSTNLSPATNFRPQIQLRHISPNDGAVTAIYTLGKLPIPFGAPHTISANILNRGSNTLNNIPVTLNLAGANTFSDTKNITSIAPGASGVVTFSGFTPVTPGFENVTVTIPNDDFDGDNSLNISQEVTQNAYNYGYGTMATGAAGRTDSTIDMTVKFTTASPTSVNQIGVNFGVGGVRFRMAIWDKSGNGTPGTILWQSDTLTSTQGVFTLPVLPNVAVTDTFYVGVRQLTTTNIQFSYQSEVPVRLNTFFFATPSGSTSWRDFAPNNPVRFMIEPRLTIPNDVGVSSISQPVATRVIDNCGIHPQAVVNNFGSNNQGTPFNVSFSIKQSGSVVYSDTRAITLSSGSSQRVYFNQFTGTGSGIDSSFVITSLASDGARNNDTVVNAFTTSNYSYGPATAARGNYAFANSTTCAIPSPFRPAYSWITETTNQVNWGINGDDSVLTTPISLPFAFKFFGIDYTQFWVCSNGWISFSNPTGLNPSITRVAANIPAAGGIENYIAGALSDLDLTPATYADAHVYYGGDATQFVITFLHAHLYGSPAYISFQIILRADGNIFVQYNEAETTSPYPTFLLDNCTVGIENNNGTAGILYRRNGNFGPMFGSPLALQYRPEIVTPVTLIDFTAKRNKKINEISWSTSQEINSKEFIIERSSNGRNFSAIGKVSAAGNSNQVLRYTFKDATPGKGTNFYRLKQVDIDNSSKFSMVRSVRNEGTTDVSVYPNPVKDVMKLSITSDINDKADINITDISGKLVYTKQSVSIVEGSNNADIDLSKLQSGTYIIKVNLYNDVVIKKFNKY